MANAETTQAQQGQNAAEGDSSSPPMSRDEITALINSAITGHIKRALAPEKIGAIVTPALESALAPFKEQIAGLAKPAPAPDAPAPKGKAKAESDEPDPRDLALAAMEKKFAKLEADHKAARELAAKERRASLEAKAISDLRAELTGKVRPEAVGVVADLLRARNAITIDENGAATMRVRFSPERGLPEEDHDLPFGDALPHFLKTKEAALFVPPPTGGAGRTGRPAPTAPAAGVPPRQGAPSHASPAAPPIDDLASAFEAQTGESFDSLL